MPFTAGERDESRCEGSLNIPDYCYLIFIAFIIWVLGVGVLFMIGTSFNFVSRTNLARIRAESKHQTNRVATEATVAMEPVSESENTIKPAH